MAFDTVIDKTQLETAMTATADAIREKTGSTADCTWDTSTGFASLIAAIEAGGGLPDGVTAVASGTYTPTTNSSATAVITHGLGVIPNFIAFITTNDNWVSGYLNSGLYAILSVRQPAKSGNTKLYGRGMIIHYAGVDDFWYYNASDFATTSTFTADFSAEGFAVAGITYRWIAGVLEGVD